MESFAHVGETVLADQAAEGLGVECPGATSAMPSLDEVAALAS